MKHTDSQREREIGPPRWGSVVRADSVSQAVGLGWHSSATLWRTRRSVLGRRMAKRKKASELNFQERIGDCLVREHKYGVLEQADVTDTEHFIAEDQLWAFLASAIIDFHTRYDMPDAVRLCSLIEDLEPYFVEDLVRSENPGVYRQLRPQVKVPIAVGEHFGDRWEINELVENRLIDYSRVTLPNSGGITEFMKIAALCETHYVGLIPHFTGPIATAALVHACSVFSGPVMMEMTGDGTRAYRYLPQCYDFRNGKLWPNRRPGLGVEVDLSQLELVAEVTQPAQPIPLYRRPDGSITNW